MTEKILECNLQNVHHCKDVLKLQLLFEIFSFWKHFNQMKGFAPCIMEYLYRYGYFRYDQVILILIDYQGGGEKNLG